MKTFLLLSFMFVFSFTLCAQTSDQVLATAGANRYTVADLPPELAEAYLGLDKSLAGLRTTLFENLVGKTVFELEAASKGTTFEKFIAGIKATVPDPPESDLKAIYDANKAAIGERDFASVKPQLIAFLREEKESKAILDAFDALKAKYKIVRGKDVNAPALKPIDVLATIGTRAITVKQFEDEFKVDLYEAKAKVYDDIRWSLGEAIYASLVGVEAKAQGVDISDFLQREISDKVRDFSSADRARLEAELRKTLFAKYKVAYVFKDPTPLVFNIPVADAPTKGAATAPVTIVMFSDFQCSHCAATHPIVEEILRDYAGKVRLAVREFPLVEIHANAFDAALAANAAKSQGKFFEYIELLYKNQDAQDRDSLKRYAQQLGLNLQQFELDFQNEKNAAAVRKDMADGLSFGISSTPTLFVNGVKVRLLTADGIREAVEKAMRK